MYYNVVQILTESQPGSDSGRLRSHRYVRAHRQSGVGLQCHRHRTAALVRHVGVAKASDRAMAHAKGSGRRRQKLEKVIQEPTGRQNIAAGHRHRLTTRVPIGYNKTIQK